MSAGDSTCEGIVMKNTSNNSSCINTEIIGTKESSSLSTITENRDKSHFTTITKDYFVTRDQHINTVAKNRNGDIWVELRKAVVKTIDQDLKVMMILCSRSWTNSED